MKKLETNQQQATTSVDEANQLAAYYQAQLLFLVNSICAPAATSTSTTTTNAAVTGQSTDNSAISDYYRQLFGYTWNDRTPTSSDAEDTGTPLVSDVEQKGDKDRQENEDRLDPFLRETGTTLNKPKLCGPVTRDHSEAKKGGDKYKEKRYRNRRHLSWSPRKTQSADAAASRQKMANKSQMGNSRIDQGSRLTLICNTSETAGRRAKDSCSDETSSRNRIEDNRANKVVCPTLSVNKSVMTDKSVKYACSTESGKYTRERTKSTHSSMSTEGQPINDMVSEVEWKEEKHQKLSVGLCESSHVPDRDIAPADRKMNRNSIKVGSSANKSPSKDGKGKLPHVEKKRATPKEEKGRHLSPERKDKMSENHRGKKGTRELQSRRGETSCMNLQSSSTSCSGSRLIHTQSKSPSHDKENRKRPPSLTGGRRQIENLRSLRGSINKQSRGRKSANKRTGLSNSSCTDIIKDMRSSQTARNVEDKRLGQSSQKVVEDKLFGVSKSLQGEVKEGSKSGRVSRKRKHSCTPPQTESQQEDVKHARTGSDVTEPSSSRCPGHESSPPVSLGSVTSPLSLTDDIMAPPTPNADEILPYCAEVQICENSALVMHESGCGQQSLLDMSCPPTPTSELLDEEEMETDQNVIKSRPNNDSDSESTEAKKLCLESSVAVTGGSCDNVAGAKHKYLADKADSCKTEQSIEPQSESGGGCNDMVIARDTQVRYQADNSDDKSEQSTNPEEGIFPKAPVSNCLEESESQGNVGEQDLCKESEQVVASVDCDNDLEEGELSDSDDDSDVENQTVSKKQTTTITFTRHEECCKETRGCRNIKTFESYPSRQEEAIKRPIHERTSVTERNYCKRVTPPRSSHRWDGAIGSMRQRLRSTAVASSRPSHHLPLSERRGNRYSPPSLKKKSSEKLHQDSHVIRRCPRGDRHSYNHHSSKHRRPDL